MAIPIRYQQIDFVPPQAVRDAAALAACRKRLERRRKQAGGVSPARSRLALPLRGFARFWHSPPLSPCVTGFDLTDIRSC